MRVRRAKTSCETSLTILALSLGESVVNHLARRCDDCQLRCVRFPYEYSPSLVVPTYHFALAREEDQITKLIGVSRVLWLSRLSQLIGRRMGRTGSP